MKEVKTPKRPLIFYYLIVIGVILLFNMLFMPMITQSRVVEVDYGTFVQMAENKELSEVEVDETQNQILFTDKDLPIFGVVIAFKDYNYRDGILGSPWAGLKYFKYFLESSEAVTVIGHTVICSGATEAGT